MEKYLGDWFTRLQEVIAEERARGRDMKALTRQVGGVGPNYVQQLMKNHKATSVDKFIRLLDVLGAEHASYIIFGQRLSDDLLTAIGQIPPESHKHFLELVRALRADGHN